MTTSRRPQGGNKPTGAARARGPSRISSSRSGGGSGGAGFRLAILVLLVCGLGFALYLAAQPEDTSDISGLSENDLPVRNLKAVLAVGLSGSGATTITEEEVNRYLRATSSMQQGGALAEKGQIDGAAVRLRDGTVEVLVKRTLFGRPHTVATRFTVSQAKNSEGAMVWNVDTAGGRIGRLPVSGQLIRMTMGPARALAAAYESELRIVRHASSVRLEENRLQLGAVTVQTR